MKTGGTSRPSLKLVPGEKAAVIAIVTDAKLARFGSRTPGPVRGEPYATERAPCRRRWFHGERYAESLLPDTRVALFGKVELDRSAAVTVSWFNPKSRFSRQTRRDRAFISGGSSQFTRPPGKISTRMFRKLLHYILEEVPLPEDELPRSVRERAGLPELGEAIRQIHLPEPDADLRLLNEFRSPAQVRLIFDEFFWLECGLALKKTKAKAATGIPFKVTDRVREQIKKMLPFKPTGAQRRVMQEIADDMKKPHPMNRLLQGDVGSGKTMVAAQAAVIALENGFQVAVLAPTEILAAQHHRYFKNLLEKFGYPVALADRLRNCTGEGRRSNV